ncbi:MAG TPA: hypothetical protein DD477_05965 [Spirochaetaceae bacterium]|nr:hypothetical protein [Spirochaetaceae bacterium]HAX37155.1 hypothetical protein [Spirochaetaceae bacterium]HBO40746.1 hypothetical protein [Spirochaetaceae bacterium]HCQ88207.1 hypothetical protein [Spirochaetaceae bacterium]
MGRRRPDRFTEPLRRPGGVRPAGGNGQGGRNLARRQSDHSPACRPAPAAVRPELDDARPPRGHRPRPDRLAGLCPSRRAAAAGLRYQ